MSTQERHFSHIKELQSLSDEQRIERAKAVYESIPLELISMDQTGEAGYGYMLINGLPFQFNVQTSHTKTIELHGQSQSHSWRLVQTARPDRIDSTRTPVSVDAYVFMLKSLGVEQANQDQQSALGSFPALLQEAVASKENEYLSFSGIYANDPTYKPDIEMAIAARIEDLEEQLLEKE